MTYQDFTNIFLPSVAQCYRDHQIAFHGLVDFDLWKKIFPESDDVTSNFHWHRIHFNAFTLDDKEKSLLLIYTMPVMRQKKEAEFIGIRLNNKRDALSLYSLRRPNYPDDFWDINQYDFDKKEEIFIDKIQGADSMREFKNAIEHMDFKEKPSLLDRLMDIIYN